MSGLTLEIIGGIVTAVALGGVLLNNRRNRWCFVLWWISNTATLCLHVHADIYALAVRDAAFLVLAVHGWFAWGRKA